MVSHWLVSTFQSLQPFQSLNVMVFAQVPNLLELSQLIYRQLELKIQQNLLQIPMLIIFSWALLDGIKK